MKKAKTTKKQAKKKPNKRLSKKNLTVKQYATAIKASGGFLADAARILNVTRSSVTQRVKRNKKLQVILEEAQEENLDLAEAKLIELVKDGNLGAICFYLKCQGKQRGYVERQEVTGGDGEPLIINIVKFSGNKSSE